MTHHYCPGRPTEAIRSLKSAHPSIMCTVPRLLEKIYAAFKDGLEKKPAWFRRIIDLALKTGEQYYGALSGGKKPSIWLRARRAFYDRLILSRVRELFGGRLKHCVVGSAALIPEVHRFFQSVGIFINNGYGLTETTATVAHTPLGHSLPGTVGTTLHGIEVRLGEDSEIQVKGPTVMSGYFKREADTAAAFTEDGFFRTGDVGEFLENGYLRITDRLKEFLRTSTGLYVSPQHLEQRLSILPYIDQAAVVGEGHSWVGALLVPNFDKLRDKARSWGAECLDNAALIIDKTVLSHVQKDIDELLANEMNHEKVRRITLIEHPFTIDNEELTPTLKLRRRAINSHYHQLIEQMFS